jgi:phosphoribosylamine---glycine ligase
VKVLIIGGGGKEHAIAWKLSQSKHITNIYCCPGNAGISKIAECIDVSPNNFQALIDFVKYEWIDFTIVGSEKLFPQDIVPAFEREGCKILGPNSTAVRVSSSRIFAKDLTRLHRLPVAEYKVFTSFLDAQDYVRLKGSPIVIKAAGQSGDDGVFVASSVDGAINILKLMMKDKILGDAGKQVIIEELLKGDRLSFVCLTDGNTILPLAGLCIYRDTGDDAGSGSIVMGAYTPAKIVTGELESTIMKKIMIPLLKALNSDGIKYRGVISVDLAVNNDRIHISEVTCGFGDQEAQTLLPRLKTDFTEIVLSVIEERLSATAIEWTQGSSVSVVISSKDHSGKCHEGSIITGLEKTKAIDDAVVFHENTAFNNNNIITFAGKIISVTAIGADMKEARVKAYTAVDKIHFDGMYYREDIGKT